MRSYQKYNTTMQNTKHIKTYMLEHICNGNIQILFINANQFHKNFN